MKAPPLSECPDPPLICDMWEESWFSFRSCWIIDVRFFLSDSLERRQGSWRWKSLTDIKCEILVSILVRQISVLPAGKKKKWEKLRQFSDVFARTSIVSTHRTHLHQSANNATRASMLRASEANARERRRKVKERSCLSPAPFSASSLYRVLPSLDSTNRKGTAYNRVKDWYSYTLHAYTCLDMAHWKPAFRGVNVKKIHMWKNDTSNRTLFFHVKKSNTSNRRHSGA